MRDSFPISSDRETTFAKKSFTVFFSLSDRLILATSSRGCCRRFELLGEHAGSSVRGFYILTEFPTLLGCSTSVLRLNWSYFDNHLWGEGWIKEISVKGRRARLSTTAKYSSPPGDKKITHWSQSSSVYKRTISSFGVVSNSCAKVDIVGFAYV